MCTCECGRDCVFVCVACMCVCVSCVLCEVFVSVRGCAVCGVVTIYGNVLR